MLRTSFCRIIYSIHCPFCRQFRLSSGNVAIRVLDIGSGGGLPGLPLAVAMPAWHVTLVDKVQKKVAFLTQARVELGLKNVECIHARAEDLQIAPFDLVVSRAFASLADFVKVSSQLIAPGGWWAAMKGAVPQGRDRPACREIPRGPGRRHR